MCQTIYKLKKKKKGSQLVQKNAQHTPLKSLDTSCTNVVRGSYLNSVTGLSSVYVNIHVEPWHVSHCSIQEACTKKKNKNNPLPPQSNQITWNKVIIDFPALLCWTRTSISQKLEQLLEDLQLPRPRPRCCTRARRLCRVALNVSVKLVDLCFWKGAHSFLHTFVF